jgi:ATP-dependent exoDNAse (exonuclease V) beta subunit
LFAEMKASSHRRAEVPYDRINDQGQPEHGIIDALYRKGGRWIVVDFKTDEIRDDSRLERLLWNRKKGYVAQLNRYAAAVESLLGERPLVKLCLLNYQGGVRILEDVAEL